MHFPFRKKESYGMKVLKVACASIVVGVALTVGSIGTFAIAVTATAAAKNLPKLAK